MNPFVLVLTLSVGSACAVGVPEPPLVLDDRLAPPDPGWEAALSPDWAEPVPPPPAMESRPERAFAALASATRQPQGALSGRVVFMNGGHGWTYLSSWTLLRPVLLEMNEDYGNVDQENMFALYCFNAGATVVPFRPLGQQTNEVVLDNDGAGVTFSGPWANGTSTIFYGSTGDVPYRYASLATTETATATYTPSLPAAGFYPVYTWARHGSDRADQLYRIRHTGGESQVRVPHYLVGNGWVFLGEYYFNAGANAAMGSVVISNLRSSTNGSVVIADALRFGNGMGSADNGAGGSRYPREDESARYWIKNSLGQGQASTLYNGSGTDEEDSWSAPPKMSAEMNREGSGSLFQRVHVSFHSNAGGGRGSIGLITGTPTPYQAQLALLAGKEVNDDLVALGAPPLEVAWNNRSSFTYSGGYSEIDGGLFNYEMAATIIEVAFHDNASDALLLRDSKARAAVGKAAMHAVVKYMNTYDTNHPAPLSFLPEAPTNPRAIASGTNGVITLSWTAPVSLGGSQSPTHYVIYRSTNGYGFGNPILVGNVTSYTITNLPADTDFYFRVSASNAGGESMPSEVVGCRASSTAGAMKVLVVNGFDRFDRTSNLRQNTTAQNYGPPDATGTIERVWPRRVNAFDYVVPHGKALSAAGMAFDSCQNEAVIGNQVLLANYPIVIWSCGNETIAGETFGNAEQTKLAAFLAANGSLFVSGADVANDLDRASGPTTADRNFLHNQLHAAYASDNSGSYAATVTAGSLFAGLASATVDDGSKGIYWVQTPDVLSAFGPGALAALNYSGGTGGSAAIQYDGSAGGGRVVLLGFPFETITSSVRRNEYMARSLAFLNQSSGTNLPPSILTPPANVSVVVGSNAVLTVVAAGTWPLNYQWRFNGANLPGATASSLTRNPAQFTHSGHYEVVVSNAFGITTSAPVATLTVTLPPAFEPVFADLFDTNSASRWTINRSTADTRVAFSYDYSADGIASAPGTGGTSRGVKFEANMTAGTPAAVSISPVGQSFTGDYRLRFHLWMNANGPFPDGGTGSTQHGTAGIGTAGDRVQWTGAGSTADGFWFAVDGEGQASDTSTTSVNDFVAFNGTTTYAATSGVYAAGTASNARGNLNSYYAGSFPGGQTAPTWQQSNFAQQTGGLAVGTIGLAWREVIIQKTGNNVDWSIDGLPIATIPGAAFTASNIFLGYWDTFASLSDNPALSFGLVDNVRVERLVTNAPPFITTHPASAAVKAGHIAAFNVVADGTAPLAFQWRFNGANLPGATASSFLLDPAGLPDAGSYSVLITNVAGTVASSNAFLTVIPLAPLKFDGLAWQPDGSLTLRLSGEPGVYAIESSTTLTNWSFVASVTNVTGNAEFVGGPATNSPALFYRARQ